MIPSSDTFVETESRRRSQERSKHILTGEFVSAGKTNPLYVMELRRDSCRGVVNTDETPGHARLQLPIPDGGTVVVAARVTWLRQLSPNSWHANFDDFEFAEESQKRTFTGFLNQLRVETEDLGVKALSSLGDEELNRLSRFIKASRSLTPCQSYIDAVSQVVEVMRKALGAERGLFLVDRSHDEIGVDFCCGTGSKERGNRFSSTVTSQVSHSGKPLLSLDALGDQELGAVSSIKMLGTVSVMCIPLGTAERRFGYVYFDNSLSRGIFKDSDLALATIIADLATGCLQQNWLHELAIQNERVTANRSLVSAVTRDLRPHLHILQDVAKRLEGMQTDLLRERLQACLEFLDGLQPKRENRPENCTDLMAVIEEIALDFKDNVQLPLPPEEGWPNLDIDLNSLSQIILDIVQAAQANKDIPVRVLVSTQLHHLRVTVLSPELKLGYIELSRVFHPSRGLNLAGTQQLVHAHRGLLRVHKAPEGGTVFTAEFNLAERSSSS